MPIKTNLNRAPYFNTYTPDSNYYEVLFKPSVSVQVRELNEIQSTIKNQIEKFGDNIFKSGTIVSGCNFTFYPEYRFVKLKDNNVNGIAIDPSLFEGMFVETTGGLKAYVVKSQDGFESSDPNLKTIFVNYVSSDVNGNTVFLADDTLTVHNGRDSIYNITINNGSSGFANTDVLARSFGKCKLRNLRCWRVCHRSYLWIKLRNHRNC